MAAIFCQALCKPCEWMQEGCVSCCNGLTRACASICGCCDELCAALGRCCSDCCTGMAKCCSACCAQLEQVFSKPFSGVVFLSVLLSIVPFAALFYYMQHYWGSPGCGQPLSTWLLVCLVLFIINFLFALYLFRRLANEDFEDPQKNPKYNPNAHQEINQFEHAKHFFLYDPIVCVYIVFGLFQIAWGIVGLSWASNAEDTCVSRSGDLVNAVAAGGIILLVFIGVTIIGITCSLYSGFITVCVNDCNIWKCLCCLFYYPLFYSHTRVRQQYYGNQPELRPRNAAQRPLSQHNAGYAPPAQQNPFGGNLVPQPQPQNMGGNVYYRPQIASPPVASPVAQPLSMRAPQVHYQAAAPPQQQFVQYQPQYQPQYQAVQQPMYQQQPPAAYNPHLEPQHQAPYQPPAQQVFYHVADPSPPPQVEGLPSAPGGAGAPGAPGGVAMPVAQPVAQPVNRNPAQQHNHQQQPSGVAKAAQSIREWWREP